MSQGIAGLDREVSVVIAALGLTLLCSCLSSTSAADSGLTPACDGYEVITEESLDPLEYGSPISTTPRGQSALAAQAWFRFSGGQWRWRVVLLLEGKLSVIDEGLPAREIPVSFDVSGAVFSDGGEYAVVISEPEPSGTYEMCRVDLSSGETRPFHATLGAMWVTDSGSYISAFTADYSLGEQGDQMSFYNDELALVGAFSSDSSFVQYIGVSPGGDLVVREDLAGGPSVLAFNEKGELLWEHALQSGRLGSEPAITADGRLVMLGHPNGIDVLDGETGHLLRTLFEGCSAWSLGVSNSGNCLAASLTSPEGRLLGVAMLEDSAIGEVLVPLPRDSSYWASSGFVSDNGWSIARCALPFSEVSPNAERKVLLDESCHQVWSSAVLDRTHGSLLPSTGNYSASPWVGGSPCAISPDGARFIYCDYDSIYIMRVVDIR